jgi:glycosyltransferase involved in cell wall biosynthesis
MKISVVNVQAPFIRGGAEYLADSLAARLTGAGHRAEIVRIPFKWHPEEALLDSMMACRLLRLDAGEPDLVIALKFPAYYVPFENKKVWLLHQFRQVYELWGTPFQQLPDTIEGHRIREMIVAADNHHLRDARAIYTNSRIVAGRLKRYNDIDADGVLYPPLLRPELFRKGEAGDYFFYPSRLNEIKRQHVAIEAMRHVRSSFRLVIAGRADDPAYELRLRELVMRWGLEKRVEFLGWISEEEKARRMANAFAALYLPFDEDSYGYVTLEAFHSHKPVLTFSDSGGTDELIVDGRNGRILDPTPEPLAEGMERLWADRSAAEGMGHEAYATIGRHGIEWPHILERLVA